MNHDEFKGTRICRRLGRFAGSFCKIDSIKLTTATTSSDPESEGSLGKRGGSHIMEANNCNISPSGHGNGRSPKTRQNSVIPIAQISALGLKRKVRYREANEKNERRIDAHNYNTIKYIKRSLDNSLSCHT